LERRKPLAVESFPMHFLSPYPPFGLSHKKNEKKNARPHLMLRPLGSVLFSKMAVQKEGTSLFKKKG